MEPLFELIKSNPIISGLITLIGLIITIWRFILYRKKTKLDFKNSDNKKAKFSIYLEDSYKLNIENEEFYILFNVKITNHSTSKNSLNAFVEVHYSDNTLKIKHNAKLFDKIPHKDLSRLNSIINLDEKEIKSGWLIFKYPKAMKNTLIKEFSIKIEDGNGQQAKENSVLIKEIIYED